jgi:hypothetical protein
MLCVFSTASDSATVTAVVSKWLPGKQRRAGWVGDYSHVAFGQKFLVKWKWETVCCPETAISFVAEVQGKEVFTHFHAVAVKCHTNTWN